MTKAFDVIDITDAAVDKIAELIASRQKGELAVRVFIRGRLPGGAYQSEFKFVMPDDTEDVDIVQDLGKFKMFFDIGAASALEGASVDFDEAKYSSGFHIEYAKQDLVPESARKDWDDPIAQQVQEIIDEQINPGIAAHYGYIILKDVEDDTVYIEMGGGCQGCGLSDVTVRQGVEQMLFSQVPQISKLVDLTEHAEGENPYYATEGADPAAGASPLGE